MTTIADYVGRTVDVLAYDGAVIGKDVLLVPALADTESPSGKITAGIQKLIQRFLILLLTERGSVFARPDEGCDFLTDLRLGYVRTTQHLQALFDVSAVDILQQMKSAEKTTDPDDERIESAVATSTLVTSERAYLQIQLTSVAGAARSILLPVPSLL